MTKLYIKSHEEEQREYELAVKMFLSQFEGDKE